ncbi:MULTISPECIES: hypothetical protein [Pseudomonas]|uniref:Type III secretion protein n=1 Tax=Pseudomonas gessardii TaxID=78544 RepID=A0ABS9F684_9PSED|nr:MULTISPECIES: hypothetical protein [Pseudomonas]MBH3421028.1 hypothetical protein [Pseudomonas gessardii]MCF4977316.1 hypothetical protein [Pseudomonas gessardii]MCF4990612.1 hypothetical protein [Pseudomonas gessardii]MCF5083222.1 hypothetical protein [Pseudomonas gessardii]MCF5093859.1 hypothetical protein [Pseudomonas gessardii]
MSISGVGGGSGGGGGFGDIGGMGNQGNIVGKGVESGPQQGGGLDPEALKKLLAQLLGGAGGAGGSQGSGGSSGGDEGDQDSMRQQMSGQQQQGVQMPPENNNSVNFG